MVSIELTDQILTVRVEGLDKLFSMRSSISVPLSHVRRVTARPDISAFSILPYDVRFWGVQSSGRFLAGTMFLKEGNVFCDLEDPQKAIAIELDHDDYQRIIVQPSQESPEEAQGRIEAAMRLQNPTPAASPLLRANP